jgi:iron complex outermembrane receptor protein
MTNVYTPKVTAAAGAQYDIELGRWGWLAPRVDYSFRSAVQTEYVNEAIGVISSVGLVNVRLAWQDESRVWETALSVTNLTDKFYYQAKQILSSPVYNVGSGTPGLPREVMFSVKRSF